MMCLRRLRKRIQPLEIIREVKTTRDSSNQRKQSYQVLVQKNSFHVIVAQKSVPEFIKVEALNYTQSRL